MFCGRVTVLCKFTSNYSIVLFQNLNETINTLLSERKLSAKQKPRMGWLHKYNLVFFFLSSSLEMLCKCSVERLSVLCNWKIEMCFKQLCF
jgi:hypothetical protein